MPKIWAVLPIRWIVERTFGWACHSRRLSKDYEISCASAENMFMISQNKYFLRKNGIHAAVVDKLINNKTIDTTTIERICKLLDCQPGEIMEYIEDDNKEGE